MTCTTPAAVARGTCSLDLFWLLGSSVADAESLPDPDGIAEAIFPGLRSAVEQHKESLGALEASA